MTVESPIKPPIDHKQLSRSNVVAACLTVLTREVYAAGLDRQYALDLLRDAPDKIEAAMTRGPNAFVIYRLDKNDARGLVSDSDSRLKHFSAMAEQDEAPLFGFCPAVIAELAVHIDAGAASLSRDA